jgi:hypothetical protein
MERRYILTLTEKQAILIKDALEEYFRIRMNQWSDLADSLVMKDIDLSPHNTNHANIFERYIIEREAVRKVFECAGRIIWENQRNPKSEEQLIAEDIWQVIRHQLWKDSENRNDWSVDSRKPLRVSNEPLPEMKKVKE